MYEWDAGGMGEKRRGAGRRKENLCSDTVF